MAFIAEVKAALGLDTTAFRRGLTQATADVGKAGASMGGKLAKAFDVGALFKGVLQGIGIGSVGQIVETITDPFRRGAEAAKAMEEVTKSTYETTIKEITAINGQVRGLELQQRQLEDISIEMAFQTKLRDDLESNPFTWISSESKALLIQAEKDLFQLNAKQAELASTIKVGTVMLNRRTLAVQAAMDADSKMANAELRNATEFEKFTLRRKQLKEQLAVLEKEGATPDVQQQKIREIAALNNQEALLRKTRREAYDDIKRAQILDQETTAIELRNGGEREKQLAKLRALQRDYSVLRKRGNNASDNPELAGNIRQQQQAKNALAVMNKDAMRALSASLTSVGFAGSQTKPKKPRARSEPERIADRGAQYLSDAEDALLQGNGGRAARLAALADRDLGATGQKRVDAFKQMPPDTAKALAPHSSLIAAALAVTEINKNLKPEKTK